VVLKFKFGWCNRPLVTEVKGDGMVTCCSVGYLSLTRDELPIVLAMCGPVLYGRMPATCGHY